MLMNQGPIPEIVEPLSSLSEYGACKKRRQYSFLFKQIVKKAPVNNSVYKRTVICIDTIQNALRYGVKNDKDIMEYMNSRYVECGFINPQQKMQILLDDWRRVMRYIKDEPRVPTFPKATNIKIADAYYRVNPHVAFFSGNHVEYVIFKIGKPTVTSKGDKNKLKRDLQLYALILYGRMHGFTSISANFYFLKKGTDKGKWSLNDQFFFGGGDNIVSMTDVYFGEENDLDRQMQEEIKLFSDGLSEEQETEETCMYCDYYNCCKYKKAVVAHGA